MDVLVCIKRVPDVAGVDPLPVGGQRHLAPGVGHPLDAHQHVRHRGQPLIRSLVGSNSGVASLLPTVTGYSSSM